jgi:predicted regulator of Ras-like GTPase activity (Roadblock/LC7/MglB family)
MIDFYLTQYDLVAIIGGFLIGFIVVLALKPKKKKIEEEEKDITLSTKVVESVKMTKDREKAQEIYQIPKDFNELVEHLVNRYMLVEATLVSSEGLPIASNSANAEEESAIAPEIVKIMKRTINSDAVTISGRDMKVILFEVTPDVICYAKARRDVSLAEIERMKSDIMQALGRS